MNVPKLRFKEFNDEWLIFPLNKIGIFSKGNLLSKADLDDEGLYPCILYGQLYTKYSEVIRNIFSKTNRNDKNLILSKYGDILIPSSGETPIDISTSSCVMVENVILGGDINILSPVNCDGRFLSYMINNNKKKEIAKVAQGHSVVHLYNDNLKKINVNIPSLTEQTKIANTLELLGKKIELQAKKIEDLKLFKKGLFNTIKNLNCDSEYLLSDIVTFENGKGHESIVDENGKYILVNSKFISTEGKVIKKCSEQLCPLKENDIVMVMSDLPNGKALSKCFYINENNKYSLNQRICLLRANENIDSKYLFYKINRNPYYLKFDDGVNQTNLKKNDILNLVVNLPSLSYQKKYSKIMTSFDKKINAEENYLNKLFELKKGLMQNMFV